MSTNNVCMYASEWKKRGEAVVMVLCGSMLTPPNPKSSENILISIN